MKHKNLTKKELLEENLAMRKTLRLHGDHDRSPSVESGMIASAMDAILTIDENQNIIQFNTAAEEIFGYNTAEVLGKSVHMLLPDSLQGKHGEHIRGFGETGSTSRKVRSLGTLSGKRSNGEVFPLEISISRGIFDNQRCYLAIIRDVSERLKLEELLVNQLDSLDTLHQITVDMINHRDIQDLLQFIVSEASKLLSAPYCEIMLPDGNELVVKACTQNYPFPPGNRCTRTDAPLSWKVLDSGTPAYLNDYSQWEQRNKIYESHHFHAAMAIPILVGNRCIGVLGFARDKQGHIFKEEDILSATRFATIAALAMENSRLYREIEILATTDELTGIRNRRSFMELGEQEIKRTSRYKRPLSAIMLDVDHFKRVNDTWGHPAGDAVLRGVAQQCANLIRKADLFGKYEKKPAEGGNIIGRFGGEEFAILLPETSLEGAMIVAERIRASIEHMVFSAQSETGFSLIQVTASLGVTSVDPESDNLIDMFTRADQALYTAKQTGRNRVCIHEKHLTPSEK